MVKHSGLTRAEIDFRIADGYLTVHVSDDGRGFDARSESEGHGLVSMRERAESLGGTLEIVTAPNQGTTVTLRTPLHPISNGDASRAATT